MKQLKKLCIVFAFCLILLPLSGCIPPWISNEMPYSFLGSIWESEDGCVRFEVGFEAFDDWYWLGTVKKEGIQIEMVFITYVTGGLEAVSYENYQSAVIVDKKLDDKFDIARKSDPYEQYEITEPRASENYFVAEVKASSVYEEGQTVTFYRVDENKDIQVQSFSIVDYEEQREKYPSDMVLAASEDIKTAVSQGKLALEEKFGDSSNKIEVYYSYLDSCWLVKRKPSWFLGSSAFVIFRTDGEVLAMWEECTFWSGIKDFFL